MKYGYVRVSTKGQNTARQDVLMKELGVDRVFVDKCSGKNTDRPQYKAMMAVLQHGDTVVVESYSRMSRSTADLLKTVDQLRAMGVEFVSKKENIDTTTPAGQLMLTIFAGLNQFEREVMLDRQREGIEAMPVVNGRRVSAKNGRGFGRPEKKVENLEELVAKQERGEITVREACEAAGISRTKWYQLVRGCHSVTVTNTVFSL